MVKIVRARAMMALGVILDEFLITAELPTGAKEAMNVKKKLEQEMKAVKESVHDWE